MEKEDLEERTKRIEEKITEIKFKMWDKLPPPTLPIGDISIQTDLRDYPSIDFTINKKTSDILDSSGLFGIRKNDKKWEIYDASNGEVIKSTNSYSKFFDSSEWDSGNHKNSENSFTISNKIPIYIHEKIDGAIISAKDIGYRYPQISNIQWQQFESLKGDEKGDNFQVILDFTIREDVNLIVWSFSIDGSEYNIIEGIEPTENKIGLEYRWDSDIFEPLKSGSILSISIQTNKPKLKGDLRDPGEAGLVKGEVAEGGAKQLGDLSGFKLGAGDQIETILTYKIG